MKSSYVLLTAAALMTGVSAQAASVISESFSQPTGSLGGVAGGTGLNNWNTNGTVALESESMSYGDLLHQGGQARLYNGGGTDAWVTTTSVLADNGLLDDGGELWFSYMYVKPNGGGSNEKGGFAFGTDRLDGAFDGTNMIADDGGNGLGVIYLNKTLSAGAWSGGSESAGDEYTFDEYGTSMLVVGKINWGATSGDDETITLYFPSTTDLGNLGTGYNQTLAGVDQSLFDTISMTQRNTPFGAAGAENGQQYDEIRFGATYDDVSPAATPIPSPTAFTAGLGLAGLLVTRRRRRNG